MGRIFLILLVPDIPISFHDIFVFFVYVFVLFLFPVSLFAMVSPGTMSSIYNKAKGVITGTGQQTQVAQGNAYRTFNIFSGNKRIGIYYPDKTSIATL